MLGTEDCSYLESSSEGASSCVSVRRHTADVYSYHLISGQSSHIHLQLGYTARAIVRMTQQVGVSIASCMARTCGSAHYSRNLLQSVLHSLQLVCSWPDVSIVIADMRDISQSLTSELAGPSSQQHQPVL